MDKDNKICICGNGINELAHLVRLKLMEMMDSGKIPSIPVCISENIETKEMAIKEFTFVPIMVDPLPIFRKEKSKYKCDGTLKKRK